ncbi:MAG: oligosaccharide flippase family protein [Proteobacteria bacterium]|nr:oligosaccharide flippase family protein [Pseudomonadota bacterium]
MSDAADADAGRADRDHSARGARTNFFTLLGQASFFLFGAVAARLFGAARWGAYTTAYAWIDVLQRTALVGGDKAALVFVAARRANGDLAGAAAAVGSTIRVTLVAAVVLALGMFAASFPIARLSGEPLDGTAMRALAAVVVSGAVVTLLMSATMATKRLAFNFIVKGVTEPLLMLACAIAFGLALPSMVGLALAPLITGVATVALAVWALGRVFPLREVATAIRAPADREMVKFAIPLAAAELLNILAMRLGSFMLLAYVSVGERGIFNTCALLAGTVSYVRGAFDTVLAPIAAEAWAQGDHARLRANLQHQSRLVLLFAVPAASVFIVAGPAILALYGPAFAGGHRALIWLALGHVVNASLGLTGWVLMAARRTRSILLNNVAKLGLDIVLSLILIPLLGIEGAALATAIAIAALHLLQIVEVWRAARIHPFSPRMFGLALVGGAVIVGELVTYHLLPGGVALRAIGVLAVGTPLYFVVARKLTWREQSLPGSTGSR